MLVHITYVCLWILSALSFWVFGGDITIVPLYLVGPARSTYAECLKRHIGKHWQQLAYHMGLTRTTIDSIALKHKNGLTAQVNEFLETMQFPDLGPYTMILILVALRSAALDCVENEVLREAVSRGTYVGHSIHPFHPEFCCHLYCTVCVL